jgi:hypothetical protein
MTHANAGPIGFGGYTSTPRDGGVAIFDAGGTDCHILTVSANYSIWLKDLTVQNNAANTNKHGFQISGYYNYLQGLLAKTIGGSGIYCSVGNATIQECEVTDFGKYNGGAYGINSYAGGAIWNCTVHDSTGNYCCGFNVGPYTQAMHCTADSVRGSLSAGFYMNYGTTLRHCDAYYSAGQGFQIRTYANMPSVLENCNAIRNGTYGYEILASTRGPFVALYNCGASGNGTARTNTLLTGESDINPINYTVNVNNGPWKDPANKDFTLVDSLALHAGRRVFTTRGYAVAPILESYPDVGSQQHRRGRSMGGLS